MALLDPSTIPVPVAFGWSRIVQVPVMLLTVTVYAAPEPDILLMLPSAVPPLVSVKSDVFTPVTASEKLTAKITVVAVVFCSVGEERSMLTTDGGVTSPGDTL